MSEEAAGRGFEPAKHLSKISGSDYLEVKWRLVWLRESHPNALIDTELIRIDERLAIFKASVSIPDGGMATGFGSESPGDFRDFIEKAETKAIGRALAALGFGTQFTSDFNFGSDQGRVVDSPVRRGSNGNQGQRSSGTDGHGSSGSADRPATEPQRTFITRLIRTAGMDMDSAAKWCVDHGFTSETMTGQQASQFIDYLKPLAGYEEQGR